jgi:uncharacterized protein
MVWILMLGAALATTVLAAGAAWGRESAMAVEVDLTNGGLVLASAGAVFAGAALWRGRGSAGVRRWLILAVLFLAVGVTVLLAHARWGTHRTEPVSFTSAGAELAGTKYFPRRDGPVVGVVFVHGSGAQTRDEHRFYARWLADRGVAALTYDKRGTGASTGELYRTTYHGYAEDAAAAVRALEAHPSIGPGCVGLVGFSEAEWVAPVAARLEPGIAFLAVIGASGLSPAAQVQAEIAERLTRRGFGPVDIKAALALNEAVFEYQRTGEPPDDLRARLANASSEPWFDAAEDIPNELHPPDLYAWWRSVMDFDPRPFWAGVTVPILLLKGERDDRSRPNIMEQRIAASVGPDHSGRLTTVVVPDADHMLLVWPYGPGTPPPSFGDGALETLLAWIEQHTPDVCSRESAA